MHNRGNPLQGWGVTLVRTIVLPLCLVAGLAGCAKEPQSSGFGASEAWRLQSLEESFLNFKEEFSTFRDEMREGQQMDEERFALLEQRMAEVQASVNAMAGRPAPAVPDTPSKTPEQPAMNDVSPEGVTPSAASPAVSQDAPADPSLVPGAGATAPAPSAVTTTPAPPMPTDASPQGLYTWGVERVRAEQFDAARNAFETFLEDNPENPLVPNALYWLGETYYGQERYAQAILTFKDVTRRFAQHHKAADALLKIGYSYAELGDAQNARFYLQALLDEFPGAPSARLARQRLSALPPGE